jgi:hypothetical protein
MKQSLFFFFGSCRDSAQLPAPVWRCMTEVTTCGFPSSQSAKWARAYEKIASVRVKLTANLAIF